MRLTTGPLGSGVRLGRPVTDRLFRTDDGGVLVLNPPHRRVWSGDTLLHSQAVEWSVADGELRGSDADGDAEVDLAHLTPAELDAAAADRSSTLTLLGSFAPLSGPDTLGSVVVGSRVLDTHLFDGRRCASEQTALSLWRTAHHRGGPFWDAVAAAVASWVRGRLDAAAGLPAHDLWGRGETHTRLLADAALLMVAAGEDTAAELALDALESLAVDCAGGRWIRHDTVERDAGTNDLVLNTHVQATLALHAGGRDVTGALRALDAVLQRGGGAAEHWVGLSIWGLGVVRALRADRGDYRWERLHERSARRRHRSGRLVTSGFVSRDASGGTPAPDYFTVNLADLAALHRNLPTAEASAALHRGLRFARASGFFTAQLHRRDPLLVLLPPTLAAAGLPRAAARWARRIDGSGIAPSVGWPGLVDRPWPRLAPGTW